MMLTELILGASARILEVSDSPFKEKLEEMGCYKGAVIKKLYRAPLGDPIAYLLGDYTLTMRKNEAETISVTLLENSSETED